VYFQQTSVYHPLVDPLSGCVGLSSIKVGNVTFIVQHIWNLFYDEFLLKHSSDSLVENPRAATLYRHGMIAEFIDNIRECITKSQLQSELLVNHELNDDGSHSTDEVLVKLKQRI
jgi:hypothetical protein